MWTMGIHGGINTWAHFGQKTPTNWLHDAAAALCRDGQLVAAAEEERFVRIKHVNFFPVESIRHCLNSQGITLGDVDRLVLSSRHMETFNTIVNNWKYGTRGWLQRDYVSAVRRLLEDEFGVDVGSALVLGGHHANHAHSAVWLSGFRDCLCVVLDAWGDGFTGMVLSSNNGRLQVLRELSAKGPATLYLQVTQLLGYDQFDEYKVMGLAPYGDPGVFADQIDSWIKYLPQGDFEVADLNINSLPTARRAPGEPFLQVHKDVAAALQQSVEKMMFHMLAYLKEQTGHRNICLAGGFFQNCTANGKLLYSGLFDNIFVQPVAYDAGLAIGGAMQGYIDTGSELACRRMPHLFLGADTPGPDDIGALLESWGRVINYEKQDDISAKAAELIAAGQVIAWVQGKAEFGARALGNRSILADPRPAANRDRINAMVKKREGYRPFAPSVLEEYLHSYFKVPGHVSGLPFMVFVVQVKEAYRQELGAITHVDGSARVQSVSRDTNELYWRLIDHFRQITGIPMVLNTSFNNSVEPIVNSPHDALNCFLSTRIDALVISRYLITKKPVARQHRIMEFLIPCMSRRYEAIRRREAGKTLFAFHDRYADSYQPVSRAAYEYVITATEREEPFGRMDEALALELNNLWYRRVFTCTGSR